ncbi:putative chitinase II [Klebsiella pneumoniae]|nr:putative chitinase II [Klebsiella pneumoniae]
MASQPADRDNFTALLKSLREAVGEQKLVTIAVGANAESPKSWVDVKAVAPVLNYINLMTYDMAYGTQYFNSNLYDSSHWPTVAAADKYSADFVVNNYLAAGLKPSQMNLGIGFYGRIPKRAVEPGIDWTKADAQNNPVTQPYFGPQQIALFASLGYDLSKDTYVKYNDIVGKLLNDPQKRFTEHWDDEAKVPWLSVQSAEGKPLFALSYENPRSVAIKADYIKAKGLAGPCSGNMAPMTRISWPVSWRNRWGSNTNHGCSAASSAPGGVTQAASPAMQVYRAARDRL